MTSSSIKAQTEMFMAIVEAAPASRDGWKRIDRGNIAKSIGVGRARVARIIAKAERDYGIQVDGDRIRHLSRHEIFLRDEKPDVLSLIAIAEDVVRLCEAE